MKQYKLFHGSVALDDSPGPLNSSVLFSLLGDNKALWQSKAFKGKSEKQGFTLSIEAVEAIELVVAWDGVNATGAPRAVWVDPFVEQ